MPAYLARDTMPHELVHGGIPVVEALARRIQACWCEPAEWGDTVVTTFDRFGVRAPLVRCLGCGTLRRPKVFTPFAASYYYGRLYRQYHPEAGIYSERFAKQREDAERVAALARGRPRGEVTEIGADTGAATDVFEGYTGVEYDGESALATLRPQSLIYAVHALEHIPEAHWIVELATRAVAPGGYLVLVVPDYSRAAESMYGAEDWATHAHVWEWTPETFEAFLRDAMGRVGYEHTLDTHVDGPGVWASIPSIVAVVRRAQ